MGPPVEKTKKELQEILTEELRKILGSNVTRKALSSPKDMTFEDVLDNLHLYERLGIAFVAIGALNGYDDQPRGFKLVER